MNNHEFSAEVGKYIKENDDLDDGDDFCYNCLLSGQITLDWSIERAASYVVHLIHPDFQ
jgi:hypothetical protein